MAWVGPTLIFFFVPLAIALSIAQVIRSGFTIAVSVPLALSLLAFAVAYYWILTPH